ncbi:hypothetical protein [Limnohabitans sp.]|uniref:hypothetical protein n=1 Tax=Limnohabitans sp. TaxID=1907725 RepID=UPI0038B7E00E
MRINEVISPLKKFIATVNVKGSQTRTMIDAESASQARLLLGKMYGEKNVVSVNQIHLNEQRIVQPTASEVKHEPLVRWLTNKITSMSNRPHFTKQDVYTAIERYKTRQKRVNHELAMQQKLTLARKK